MILLSQNFGSSNACGPRCCEQRVFSSADDSRLSWTRSVHYIRTLANLQLSHERKMVAAVAEVASRPTGNYLLGSTFLPWTRRERATHAPRRVKFCGFSTSDTSKRSRGLTRSARGAARLSRLVEVAAATVRAQSVAAVE